MQPKIYTRRLMLSGIVIVTSILMLVALVVAHSGFYGAEDDVVELTTSNFDRLVVQDDAVWIVKFYATWCSYCHTMVPEYKKLAKALKGVAKVGAVDGEQNRELSGKYEIRGFPMIKIFGVDKSKPSDYFETRSAKAMGKAVVAEIKKKMQVVLGRDDDDLESKSLDGDVIELQTDNFDKLVFNSEHHWLVEFYMPGCPSCQSLTPEWAKAARELKGKMSLGALDASEHKAKAEEYNVSGYPTIKYFPAKSKLASDAQDYAGGKRVAAEIISWAEKKLESFVPAPQVLQLTDEASYESACGDKSWCVISVLPSLLDCDAKCRNKLLHTVRQVGDKFKMQPWGWLWNEAGDQPLIEQGLRVSGSPALVVVNCNQMKFALFKGSFTKENLAEFLANIANGRGQKMIINCARKPPINRVAAWHGEELPHVVATERSIADEL